MSAFVRRAGWPVQPVLAVLVWLVLSCAGFAQDKVQVQVTPEDGFGRIILEFSNRMDLPAYKINYDNNVLTVTFTDGVTVAMPDMAATLPDYLTIGRADPDGRGIRFGLRSAVTIHSMEAAEKLFIDLLPVGWQGLPPSLPPEVVADLAQRARDAERIAEERRKAEEAKALNPRATLQIGRNPTFYRVEMDWSTDTKATFKQDGSTATVNFDWPVAVDLYALKADLPPEIKDATNAVSASGSLITFSLADGVTPRFYEQDPQHFTFDIDLTPAEVDKNRTTAEAAARKAEEEAAAAAKAAMSSAESATPAVAPDDPSTATAITPKIEQVSGTVRMSFPFERDTASAVFRRGDTLWMLFDTPTVINQPSQSDALSSIASAFQVTSAGSTQFVCVVLLFLLFATHA